MVSSCPENFILIRPLISEELNDRHTDTHTPDRKWASIGGREARMVNSDTQTASDYSLVTLLEKLSPLNEVPMISNCESVRLPSYATAFFGSDHS
jgi:hypothetical protein